MCFHHFVLNVTIWPFVEQNNILTLASELDSDKLMRVMLTIMIAHDSWAQSVGGAKRKVDARSQPRNSRGISWMMITMIGLKRSVMV